jgi:hypothetical protein
MWVQDMDKAIYLEFEFWGLVGLSLLIPIGVFVWLIRKRKISRIAVSAVGASLVLMSGADFILLQRLAAKARMTPALWDDTVFVEYSLAFYLLPLIMAGMGINLMSHILHEHVIIAELEYEKEKGHKQPTLLPHRSPDA